MIEYRNCFEADGNLQVIIFGLALCRAIPTTPSREEQIQTPLNTNLVQRYLHTIVEGKPANETKGLKKVFLSKRTITCNDGSQSGFYLRKSNQNRKWIIYLEGGFYCYDDRSCQSRWLRQRHYMTSSQWPEIRDVGGILSQNVDENPYWWNANHVLIPYCSSDSWTGSKVDRKDMFTFMGSLIVSQVVRDLVPLGLENGTDLLLAGSSAGGIGVMLNLDLVQELLHDTFNLKHIIVRGVMDSGWFLDRPTPTGKPVIEALQKGIKLWEAKIPKRCLFAYAAEPWRCYIGYRMYPTLKAPLFVFQWLFDEAQMDVDNVGTPVTKQQWDHIHKMGNALRKSFKNVSAVFAPSCISHSVLTKRDWLQVKVEDISFGDALYCWEQSPVRKNMRRMRNSSTSEEPHMVTRQVKRIPRINPQKINPINGKNLTTIAIADNKRRKRRKHHGNRKPKTKRDRKRNCNHLINRRNRARQHAPNNFPLLDDHGRFERSTLKSQKRSNTNHCPHRRLERCTWPQCNRSCPKFHNPYTGEEMDFIELLKSFGLDMESVANALGIDMPTLNNMDHADLLNLLTQQTH
ncbi:notum-related [Holotrichia oblita]|uniref:Notum-related n=1 Tax=Holotrichia oblita TaxID=644536 RepID=A0ACB9ST50_HOLOL|nr:notum-related [Holotrichia oblita]